MRQGLMDFFDVDDEIGTVLSMHRGIPESSWLRMEYLGDLCRACADSACLGVRICMVCGLEGLWVKTTNLAKSFVTLGRSGATESMRWWAAVTCKRVQRMAMRAISNALKLGTNHEEYSGISGWKKQSARP